MSGVRPNAGLLVRRADNIQARGSYNRRLPQLASVARKLLVACPMTLPREVLPNQFYTITRRCTQRQFLLRPDPEFDNAYLYCLIEAAIRFDVGLIQSTAMSNHHHTTIYDRVASVCEFMEHFHKMLAKCVNSLRGRWENCWSSQPPCVVRLLDRAEVINQLVYAATNPVKDGLVDTVAEWPGVNTIGALFEGRELRARRPKFFFREDGCMPCEVSIKLEVPPALGEPQVLFDELGQRIAKTEARHMITRAVLGRTVLGRRRVLRQSWQDSPTSREPRRLLRPRFAANSTELRIEALLQNQAFLIDYQRARREWLAGTTMPFPPGTYWLRRFAGVPVATLPSN